MSISDRIAEVVSETIPESKATAPGDKLPPGSIVFSLKLRIPYSVPRDQVDEKTVKEKLQLIKARIEREFGVILQTNAFEI